MFVYLWSMLLVTGWLAVHTDACSCIYTHPQENFCGADFVMRMRLRSKGETIYTKKEVERVDSLTQDIGTVVDRRPLEIKYEVKVKRIYKAPENSSLLEKDAVVATLYTGPDEGRCGVFLEIRTDYLVSGYINGDKLWISLCGWYTPWVWVTKMQRKYLRSIYANNCDCKVSELRDKQAPDSTEAVGCVRSTFSTRGQCYQRHSACIKDRNSTTGGCKWHRNRSVKECRADARRPQLP